jgi:peptide-methionine (S)-S-oxide reductase
MSETIYLGAGCYWCVEAVYQRVVGVQDIVSGFMGGAKANPTYKEVRARYR